MCVYFKVERPCEAAKPLFLDVRDVRAELVTGQAALVVARSQLARLDQSPRSEEVPPAERSVSGPGYCLRRRARTYLHTCGRMVPVIQDSVGDYGRDTVFAGRNPAGSWADGRVLHGHLDDRIHCRGRHSGQKFNPRLLLKKQKSPTFTSTICATMPSSGLCRVKPLSRRIYHLREFCTRHSF
jgi:hypothetical protein